MRNLAKTVLFFTICIFLAAPAGAAKEFLTGKEIEKIQDTYEIDARVRIYMEAAALRLKTAEERLTGKESAPGDPLEFFTPEDMLDSYYRILKSVMTNIDDAARNPKRDNGITIDGRVMVNDKQRIGKALKQLKSETEKDLEELLILKKIAEEKKNEHLWDLINEAVEITNGAHEGAGYGLSKQPSPAVKDNKNK
ncbi:MAG: hypothetical protein ABSC60_17465 [Acidobacteriota bacterium]|jgi:hypothetical protein